MKDKIQKWWGESTKNKAILICTALLLVFCVIGATNASSKKSTVADKDNISSETDIINKFSPKDVYDDDSCHWYLATIYENIQMQDIAREYVEKFVEDSADIHYIVNLYLKTTSVVYDMPALDIINVRVYEYVDGEEHNTDAFATGMKLAEYHIDKKTGEIEKVD